MTYGHEGGFAFNEEQRGAPPEDDHAKEIAELRAEVAYYKEHLGITATGDNEYINILRDRVEFLQAENAKLKTKSPDGFVVSVAESEWTNTLTELARLKAKIEELERRDGDLST